MHAIIEREALARALERADKALGGGVAPIHDFFVLQTAGMATLGVSGCNGNVRIAADADAQEIRAIAAQAETVPPFCAGCATVAMWKESRSDAGISHDYPLIGGPIDRYEAASLYLSRDHYQSKLTSAKKALSTALASLNGGARP